MIKLGKGISFGKVQDETLICNSLTHQMIKLDKQGTEIWTYFYETNNIMLVIDFFVEKFKDSKEKVKKDIIIFYNTLIDIGVLSNEEYKKIQN